jgi:hypothetical protein
VEPAGDAVTVYTTDNIERDWVEFVQNWWMGAVALLLAVFIIFWGLCSSSDPEGLKKALADPASTMEKRIIAAWESDFDPETESARCRDVGGILRDLERKDFYEYKLILILPKGLDRDYLIVNDGGICWETGTEERMSLVDPEWLEKAFDKGTIPGSFPNRPFGDRFGSWKASLVREYSLAWGVLLAQKSR